MVFHVFRIYQFNAIESEILQNKHAYRVDMNYFRSRDGGPSSFCSRKSREISNSCRASVSKRPKHVPRLFLAIFQISLKGSVINGINTINHSFLDEAIFSHFTIF